VWTSVKKSARCKDPSLSRQTEERLRGALRMLFLLPHLVSLPYVAESQDADEGVDV